MIPLSVIRLPALLLVPVILLAAPASGQSVLENAAFFAAVEGLNTVPDRGDEAVSFLDYRNGGYSIVTVDASTGAEQVLERVFYAEPVVSTFGKRVAWIGYTPAGQPDVYVHDRASVTTTRVTSDAAFQNHPDLSENVLVWQDYRHALPGQTRADIYMYEFATGTTSPVTTDAGYQDLPRIHGDRIVWQDYRHAGPLLKTADIYVYDLSTRQERRLTDGAYYRTRPTVWGDLVVWEDYRNGENGDIFLYDLGAEREIRITTHAAHQCHPAVYGDWVLWLDYRNSSEQGDLYGYNLRTLQEYALVVHPAHQDAPYVYADHVVWQDYRDGRFDLFGGMLLDPSATTAEEAVFSVDPTLIAAPNPFGHSVTFFLGAAGADPLHLTIYDALGRTVNRRATSPGDAVATWDGRDLLGHLVPSGVYMAIVRAGSAVRRVLVVRHE
jgi:beta propeller repeat protein